MDNNAKNTAPYSISDIQKYLRGELSAQEMRRLELAALEDPFLSDALEGLEIYQAHSQEPSLQQDLHELQQRLDKRISKKDRRPVLFFHATWRIAAAVILLLGLGLTAYYTFLNTSRQKAALARAAEKRDIAPGASAATPSAVAESAAPNADTAEKPFGSAKAATQTATDTEASANLSKKAEEAPEPAAIARIDKATADKDKAAAARDQIATSDQVTAGNQATGRDQATGRGKAAARDQAAAREKVAARDQAAGKEKAAAVTAFTPPAIISPMPGRAFNKNPETLSAKPLFKAMNMEARRDTTASESDKTAYAKQDVYKPATAQSAASDRPVYTGKVIDQYNNPLPGASLYLKGNYSIGSTVTDKNGLFSIRLPKKDDSAIRLTAISVGYVEASLGVSMQNRTGNIIQLQPQANALSEVVVSGYGAKRKEVLQDNSQPRKQFITKRAIPADGWPAYQNYLEANKTAINPDSTLKGDEIISFLVDKTGNLSSFKVEKSLSPAHDSAAIQLIRQGPSWKLLKGNQTRAWITIPF